ncbi:helix-turn-helix transcriptional regulator [Tessaracoccus sp. Z1128]
MVAGDWTFLSNYGHVLVALAKNPSARMRDIAQQVGITERAVQQIVSELVSQGYVIKEKSGRRNQYRLAGNTYLRHPLEADVGIADFLALACAPQQRPTTAGPPVGTVNQSDPPVPP